MNLHGFFSPPEGTLSVESNFPVSREIIYFEFLKSFQLLINKVAQWATRWILSWLESSSQNNYQ